LEDVIQIAVYGGSFNPPHVSHAMVASWLLWTGQVDAVWLLPVYQHAFDGMQKKRLAPWEVRLSWCASLTQDVDTRVQVCDIEASLPTPSYTIDTLRALQAKYPSDNFRLIVGADVIPQLPLWRNWQGIEEEFSPIVVGRGGYPVPDGSVVFPEVSSSEIRTGLLSGDRVDHLLTRGVLESLKEVGREAMIRFWR